MSAWCYKGSFLWEILIWNYK